MELFRIGHPHSYEKQDFPPLAMALGYFDGVHLGHQEVIKEANKTAQSKGLKSAVMTFDPHPSVVLGKGIGHVEYITPLEDKIGLIEQLGVDYLFIVHFTHEFAGLLPQEFIDEYVIGLNAKQAVAGFDFTYGKMGKGTMETIQFHSRGQFDYTVVPKLSSSGEKISSTAIRACLRAGDMDKIPGFLGRRYTTAGAVIHGDKRGRTIGFPTANVDVPAEYILPPIGVYAVRIKVKGSWHQGVCNLGHKPTFKDVKASRPTVEVYIFDFNEEIYGEQVVVEWHQHIRSERKFSGIDELVEQIGKDKQEAQAYFENSPR